jgi:hypothetical protein
LRARKPKFAVKWAANEADCLLDLGACPRLEIQMIRPEILQDFFHRYNLGNTAAALRCVLNDPAVAFDAIAAGDPQRQAMLNYVDALAFSNIQGAHHAGTFLSRIWQENSPALSFDLSLMETRGRPGVQEHFLRCEAAQDDTSFFGAIRYWVEIELERRALVEQELLQTLAGMALVNRRLLALQVRFSSAYRSFWRQHQSLFEALGAPDRSHAALLRSADPAAWEQMNRECRQIGAGLLVIFMEGFDWDWAAMLKPLIGRPAWFVFRDVLTLGHCLFVPAIMAALHDPAHGLLVLDRYVQEQLGVQPHAQLRQRPLRPILFWDQRPYRDRVPLFLEALESSLAEPEELRGKESLAANWLYHLGRSAQLALHAHRLGVSRYPYLQARNTLEIWNDPHKGRLPQGVALGPAAPDFLGSLLAEIPPAPPRRRPARQRRLRLAHITAQVVDGSHAPSRLMRTLIRNHDRDRFDLSVLVTEGFVLRPDEYPVRAGHSAPSTERAPKTLRAFQEDGIQVSVSDPGVDFRETAQAIARMISEQEIDAAVFHGPDFIHHAIAARCDVPVRILFEHGSLPDHPGFDIAVASAESAEGVERLKPRFAAMGTELVRNPHVVDARESWEPDPYPTRVFGLPEDALILTTISNHLEHRLSDAMCLAIVEILRRCPNAYYAPMGPVRKDSRVARFFAGTDVASRVKFLGTTACPSQCARSMHVYLNEFPFGGGIALLDALAAGCPIVSMHDENGPAQAKYVAVYYGMDRVVTTLNPADYVNLACALLTDPEMHREWCQAAIRRYEQHADVRGYVRRFEEIVLRGLAHQK